MPNDSPAQATPSPGEPTHVEVGYEKTDINPSGIVWFGVWFVVILAIINLVIWGLFSRMYAARENSQPEVPFAQERPRFPRDLQRIPAPRLEVDKTLEYEEFRQKEDGVLTSYSWEDQKKGLVRIPVAQALRLLSDPQTAARHGLVLGEPGGGKEKK